MKRIADHDVAAPHLHDNWHARLSLGFADDGGATRMIERSHFGPLRVQKPLYPEGPAVCHAIVVHPPGGVVGGDQLDVAARVGAGAAAFLTSPGAAKWYKANGRRSAQRVTLHAGAGASIEWLPQETIFFDAADVQLETAVALEGDATFIGCETLCFGRTASGESFDSGRIAQRTTIRRDGKLIWHEQGALAGGSATMRSPLGLGGKTVCATLIVAGKPVSAASIAALREALLAVDAGTGVTQLKSVLVVRYLGDSSETARLVTTRAWQLLRPLVMAREAVTPRIWNT